MPFKTIGLIGKPAHEGANKSLNAILDFLRIKGCRIIVETKVSDRLNGNGFEIAELEDIGKQADLAIVVGGDGNMLGAARILAKHDVAVVGVNRGNLGFLTDINPDDFEHQLECIFNGECVKEQRFILQVEVYRKGQL